MSDKLKIGGIAVVAALAISAVTAMSASATGVGHFTSEVSHTTVVGELEGEGNKFTDPTLPDITCNKESEEATFVNETETQITASVTPEECSTSAGVVHVSMNGCQFTGALGTHAETTHTQVSLTCPGMTKHITLQATNFAGSCTITVPEQTPEGGGVVTTIEVGGKHALTGVATFTGITSTVHPDGFGACLFAATHRTEGSILGQGIAKGFNTNGEQVSITATGSTGS